MNKEEMIKLQEEYKETGRTSNKAKKEEDLDSEFINGLIAGFNIGMALGLSEKEDGKVSIDSLNDTMDIIVKKAINSNEELFSEDIYVKQLMNRMKKIRELLTKELEEIYE